MESIPDRDPHVNPDLDAEALAAHRRLHEQPDGLDDLPDCDDLDPDGTVEVIPDPDAPPPLPLPRCLRCSRAGFWEIQHPQSLRICVNCRLLGA
jgi:hypothetical protein